MKRRASRRIHKTRMRKRIALLEKEIKKIKCKADEAIAEGISLKEQLGIATGKIEESEELKEELEQQRVSKLERETSVLFEEEANDTSRLNRETPATSSVEFIQDRLSHLNMEELPNQSTSQAAERGDETPMRPAETNTQLTPGDYRNHCKDVEYNTEKCPELSDNSKAIVSNPKQAIVINPKSPRPDLAWKIDHTSGYTFYFSRHTNVGGTPIIYYGCKGCRNIKKYHTYKVSHDFQFFRCDPGAKHECTQVDINEAIENYTNIPKWPSKQVTDNVRDFEFNCFFPTSTEDKFWVYAVVDYDDFCNAGTLSDRFAAVQYFGITSTTTRERFNGHVSTAGKFKRGVHIPIEIDCFTGKDMEEYPKFLFPEVAAIAAEYLLCSLKSTLTPNCKSTAGSVGKQMVNKLAKKVAMIPKMQSRVKGKLKEALDQGSFAAPLQGNTPNSTPTKK